jgi:hypothetical protein
LRDPHSFTKRPRGRFVALSPLSSHTHASFALRKLIRPTCAATLQEKRDAEKKTEDEKKKKKEHEEAKKKKAEVRHVYHL